MNSCGVSGLGGQRRRSLARLQSGSRPTQAYRNIRGAMAPTAFRFVLSESPQDNKLKETALVSRAGHSGRSQILSLPLSIGVVFGCCATVLHPRGRQGRQMKDSVKMVDGTRR